MRFFKHLEAESQRNPAVEFSLAAMMFCGAGLLVVGIARGGVAAILLGVLFLAVPAPWLWGRISRSR